jgi:hypothetical protein
MLSRIGRQRTNLLALELLVCTLLLWPKEGMASPIADRNSSDMRVYLENGSSRVEVYYLDQQRFAQGFIGPSGRILEGDMGGAIYFCSNNSFYCLDILNLSVPRQGMRGGWTHGSHRCQSLPLAGNGRSGEFSIICRMNGSSRSVAFIYSLGRGIISYRRICAGCRNAVYSLRGSRGLFPQSR